MTKTLNKEIDAFQRHQRRYVINVAWPQKISNEKVYEITNVIPWHERIEKRRLSWLGHLMRLDPETPARIALKEAMKPTQRKRGRPPATWLSVIQNDLNKRNIDIHIANTNAISQLERLARDRDTCNETVSMLPRERIFKEPTAPLIKSS